MREAKTFEHACKTLRIRITGLEKDNARLAAAAEKRLEDLVDGEIE